MLDRELPAPSSPACPPWMMEHMILPLGVYREGEGGVDVFSFLEEIDTIFQDPYQRKAGAARSGQRPHLSDPPKADPVPVSRPGHTTTWDRYKICAAT